MQPGSFPSAICRIRKLRLRLPMMPSLNRSLPRIGEEGLDVFEDFLKKLKDDPGDEEENQILKMTCQSRRPILPPARRAPSCQRQCLEARQA